MQANNADFKVFNAEVAVELPSYYDLLLYFSIGLLYISDRLLGPSAVLFIEILPTYNFIKRYSFHSLVLVVILILIYNFHFLQA
jgi:hypothetical protein